MILRDINRSNVRFFFNDTATTEIYTLSLHDALPIYRRRLAGLAAGGQPLERRAVARVERHCLDRKSTRLNSSHVKISYAVFCLKKKKASSLTHNEYYLAKASAWTSDSDPPQSTSTMV